MQNESRRRWDSNPQSLPPESNALPLGHAALDTEGREGNHLCAIRGWYQSIISKRKIYDVFGFSRFHKTDLHADKHYNQA
jgi:hypothetical protein